MKSKAENFVHVSAADDVTQFTMRGAAMRAWIERTGCNSNLRVYVDANKVTIKLHETDRANSKVLDSITIDAAASIESGEIIKEEA